MSTLYTILIGIICVICHVKSSVRVIFNIPKLVHKTIPYSLIIHNNLQDKSRFENFVLSFELINPNNKEIVGIAAITTTDFKSDDFRGFSIDEFTIKEETIEMKIIFRKEVHDNLFRIRYSQEKTEKEKVQFFEDKSKGIVFQKIMEMYLPYTITLLAMPEMGVVSPDDKSEVGSNLIPEKYGLLTCEASNGLPSINPQFVNSQILKGGVEKIVRDGINSFQWRVLIEDHGKVINCRAGNDEQNLTLTVYHYVSEVLSSPPIDNKVSRNSQLKCISKDGYPVPKVSWTFISGPTEAWKFYQLRDNNVTLFINSSAPINSNWSFECRGWNDVPQVVQKYLPDSLPNYPIKKLYNFTVIDANEIVLASQTGVVVTIVFIFIIALVVAVVCVLNRFKIRTLAIQYLRILRPETITEKPTKSTEPIYKYSEINKGDTHPNGADDNPYADIVGIVQSKSGRDPALGPIDRV